MLHHTDVIGLRKIAPGGWIFVEFYFIISGFFVTKHFDNENMNNNIEKEALLYTITKLKNVIPYAYVGIFIGAFNQIINNSDSFSTICEVLLSLPANLLFLGGLGIARYNLNGPLWYLSVMILVMPLLILLLVKARTFFYYLGSWIIPLFLYLLMFSVRGNIQYWEKQYYIHCLLRAIAGLSAGSCTFYLCKSLKSIKMSFL